MHTTFLILQYTVYNIILQHTIQHHFTIQYTTSIFQYTVHHPFTVNCTTSFFSTLYSILFQYTCNKFKKTRRRLLLCSEVDRARFTIHNTISAPNVSPHVPPPFTASTRGEQRQLALERRDVNTSDQELLTPSYCCRCLL